jgi:hypothetical protein
VAAQASSPDVASVILCELRRLANEPSLGSDFNLFCNQKGIVDINPKIPNSALDLGVAEQKLDSPEIASPSVDH